MFIICAAALCSVLVSILLKKFTQHGLKAIALISWNYVAATLLCFFWFKPTINFPPLSHTTWWLIILLGALLPSIFFLLSKSLTYAGLVKTEIAQRISVILSLSAAFFLFNEQFSLLKVLGIGCGLIAVGLLIWKKGLGDQAISKQAVVALLAVWGGYGLVDILLKYNSSLGSGFAMSLNLIFAIAGCMSFIFAAFTIQKAVFCPKHILAGLLLGGFNFANIALYVTAHQALKDAPSIVFATMNLSVVLLGGLVGVFFFKEKLNRNMLMSFLFAVLAIILMTKAMS